MSLSDRLLLALVAFHKRRLFAADPLPHQTRLLLSLVQSAAHTRFGRAHDFRSIRSPRDFFARVPPRTYAQFNPYLDAILKGEPDVLFPGNPVCFAATTGTEGAAKLIPLNRALLAGTRRAAIEAALLGGLAHGSLAWRRGKVLYIGPRKGRRRGDWMVYSEGTAFAYRQAKFFTTRFVPSYDLLPEPDQPPDFTLLQQLARQHRITSVAGNPLEIVAFAQAAGMVMPAVELVINCGFWAADLLPFYATAFPHAHVADVYSSNEATCGLPVAPGLFLLNYRRVVFAFVPLDNNGPPVSLEDVEPNRKYALCITTPGGLWNYLNGDVVEFTSLRPPLFRCCGRRNRAVSLAGEWLTENEVVAAVRNSGVRGMNYHLTPAGRAYVLHVDREPVRAELVDRRLCELNSAYARLRAAGELQPLTVEHAPLPTPPSGKPARILAATP